MVFLLSPDYLFAKPLVPVLIPEDLEKSKKNNKNCANVNKKQNLSPTSVQRPFLNKMVQFLIIISKIIQCEAENKYRKFQPKWLRLDKEISTRKRDC